MNLFPFSHVICLNLNVNLNEFHMFLFPDLKTTFYPRKPNFFPSNCILQEDKEKGETSVVSFRQSSDLLRTRGNICPGPKKIV